MMVTAALCGKLLRSSQLVLCIHLVLASGSYRPMHNMLFLQIVEMKLTYGMYLMLLLSKSSLFRVTMLYHIAFFQTVNAYCCMTMRINTHIASGTLPFTRK